jgi:hypothetical protein
MNGQKIAALLIGVTIAATLLTPVASTVTDNTGTQTVTNTTVTADVGNWSADLEGYNVVQTSETVYWYNSSSGANETLTEGTDYEFDYDDARVKPLSGGSVSDGDTLYVSYDYQATSGTVQTVSDLIPMFLVLLILVTIGNKLRV